MRQKNQIELNSGTGAEGGVQSAAVREIEASAAKASLERPARADEVIELSGSSFPLADAARLLIWARRSHFFPSGPLQETFVQTAPLLIVSW